MLMGLPEAQEEYTNLHSTGCFYSLDNKDGKINGALSMGKKKLEDCVCFWPCFFFFFWYFLEVLLLDSHVTTMS